MRIFPLVVLAFILVSVANAESLHPRWQFVYQKSDIWLWKHQKCQLCIGTLRSQKVSSPTKWEAITSAQFFRELTRKKQSSLGFVGISAWQPDKFLWKKNRDYYQLDIEGSYRDSDAKKVHFFERHLYGKTHHQYILLAIPENNRENIPAQEFIEGATKVALGKWHL